MNWKKRSVSLVVTNHQLCDNQLNKKKNRYKQINTFYSLPQKIKIYFPNYSQISLINVFENKVN